MEQTLERPDSIEPSRKRWTREEYRQLFKDGFLDDGKYELIEGEIIQKMGHGRRHTFVLTRLLQTLGPVFGINCIQTQATLTLPTDNDPEPDVAVLKNDMAEYLDSGPQPEEVELIVEVSDSTLRLDKKVKAIIYSRIGIAEYWIVNINDRVVEVYRDPMPDGYASQTTVTADGVISPLAAPQAQIAVADLLP